ERRGTATGRSAWRGVGLGGHRRPARRHGARPLRAADAGLGPRGPRSGAGGDPCVTPRRSRRLPLVTRPGATLRPTDEPALVAAGGGADVAERSRGPRAREQAIRDRAVDRKGP